MTFKAEVTEVTHNPDVCVYCVTIFRPRFFFVLTLFYDTFLSISRK